MLRKRTPGATPEEADLRIKIVKFVKARGWRHELTIVDYIMDKLRLGKFHISNEEALYQLARCVEAGPLMWFGAEESKWGTRRAGAMPMKYRYDPLVSMKEKRMEITGLAEIETLCALYKRLKKKEKPVEPVIEALNRLGSRRPKKQRFSVSYNHKDGGLTMHAVHTEWLPSALRKIAARMVIESEQKETAEV